MKFHEFISVLGQVYKNKKYFYFTIISSVLFFTIFYKLTLTNIADNSLEIFIMMSGYNYTFFALLSFAIISILFGIYLSMAIYKFNLMKKRGMGTGFVGFIGFFAGVFGAGCPTCGSAVFALFGAPLALMYLPFRGLELRILSILLLGISIYFLSKSLIKCETCNIK